MARVCATGRCYIPPLVIMHHVAPEKLASNGLRQDQPLEDALVFSPDLYL